MCTVTTRLGWRRYTWRSPTGSPRRRTRSSSTQTSRFSLVRRALRGFSNLALQVTVLVVLPTHWCLAATGAIIIPELDAEERCRLLNECELPPAAEFPAQALVEQAVRGDLDAFKDLLEDGHDPKLTGRSTNKDGRPYCTSPLGAAAANGHLEIAADEPELRQKLWSNVAGPITITTEPEGARIYAKPYSDPNGSWKDLGKM